MVCHRNWSSVWQTLLTMEQVGGVYLKVYFMLQILTFFLKDIDLGMGFFYWIPIILLELILTPF